MEFPGLPADETARLRALEALGGLELRSSPELDRITRLAARHFDVPVAMVNLVLHDEQQTCSSHGLPRARMPRALSFCAHAILQPAVFVIEDARLDVRFSDNPAVRGESGLVFYAGCPVRSTRGHALGTLCLMDRQPHHFDAAQCQDLQDLAALVEQHLQGIEAARRASLSETQFGQIFAHATIGMGLVTDEGLWLRANAQLGLMLGRSPEDLAGTALATVLFGGEAQALASSMAALRDGAAAPAGEHEVLFSRPDGRLVWCLLGLCRLEGLDGGFLLMATDISVRKASEQALAVLQLELEHRVEARTAELSQEVLRREAAQQALEQEKEHFRATLANATDAFVEVDERCWVTGWNQAAGQAFGWTAWEAIGRSLSDLIVPSGQQLAHGNAFRAYLSVGPGQRFEQRFEVLAQHRDGRLFPVEMSLSEIRHGGRLRVNAFLHDITGRKARERELVASRARLRLLADNLPALVAYVDEHLVYQFNNLSYQHWFGVAPEAIVGRSLPDFVGAAAFDDMKPQVQRVQEGRAVSFEGLMRTLDGELRVHTALIPDTAMDGPPYGFYVLAQDITEQYLLEQQLKHEASHDALTGLPNRRAFLRQLSEALARARRQHVGLALLFLDLDGFKGYNDQHGHDFGDAVLRHFARTLLDSVRETDGVARLAGDEFTVILEGLSDPALQAAQVARKLIHELGRPALIGGREVVLSSSIGVAVSSQDAPAGLTAQSLLKRADAAMYQAKAAGKGQFALG
ncbi:MAG: diguanylate cyclase [Curvibacter sp.]|nr:diguanylate cyclase [Curvibacter sp.]